MSNRKILIIEDDKALSQVLKMYLEKNDFTVITSINSKDILQFVQDNTCDLIMLDIDLPTLNGFEICKKIREISFIPVIFMSGYFDTESIVTGLEAGGDDYITKPFDMVEVIARIHSLIRRSVEFKTVNEILEDTVLFNELLIDYKGCEVSKAGKPISLSAKEFSLLSEMSQKPNQVFTTRDLYAKIWDSTYVGDLRTVMVHISNLRKKIENDPSHPEYIINVRGIGYKFAALLNEAKIN